MTTATAHGSPHVGQRKRRFNSRGGIGGQIAGWLVGLFISSLIVGLIIIPALSHGAAVSVPKAAPSVGVQPDLTQLDGYQLRQIALPGFAYLYNYVYNYRDAYPVLAFTGPCSGGVLYLTNASKLDCYTVANATAWAISPALTLLYQRTAGIQAQIDNEFQLDEATGDAILYGNLTTTAGDLTVEVVNLTTGIVRMATTPVPMANSVQCDDLGAWLVTCFNATGTNGAPELTNLSNGTSWRSGLGVGVAADNVYWVPQLGAFINVAGTHFAELKLEAGGTKIVNVGNAWTNRSGLSSVSAVNGILYNAATGELCAQLSTNLGDVTSVVKLTNGVLTPLGAYDYLTTTTLYVQRYAYTTPYVWSLTSGSVTVLTDPFTNSTISAPNLVSRANGSGANSNYEFSDPYSTGIALSLTTSLTGNATRAPNQFVYATAPLAVHARSFVLSNGLGWATGKYQQTLTVDSALDAPWEAANLSNVFWTYASNGTSIPAWLQNGSSNTATATTWELSLASIGAHGTLVVDEDFAPTADLTFGRLAQTGEAPSLTTTYGAFDNGAIVFPMYDNFAGTSLNTHIWTASFATGSATVSNGLTTTSVQTGHGTRPACGLVANYNNLSGSFDQQAEIGHGGMGDSKQIGLFTTATAGSSGECAGSSEIVQEIDLSATDYEGSNIYGVFSQTSSGNNYAVNTVNLVYTKTASYEMGLAQANDSAHNYANTSINATPANSAGQRFGNLVPSGRLYPGIALWSGNGLAIGNLTWWRETAEVSAMPSVTGVPLAPTNLANGTASTAAFTLTWANPPGTVVNDTVSRWVGPSCVGTAAAVNSTQGEAATFTVTGLSQDTAYSVEVAAWNASGEGTPSSCLTVTTAIAGPYGGYITPVGWLTFSAPAWEWALAVVVVLVILVAVAAARRS